MTLGGSVGTTGGQPSGEITVQVKFNCCTNGGDGGDEGDGDDDGTNQNLLKLSKYFYIINIIIWGSLTPDIYSEENIPNSKYANFQSLVYFLDTININNEHIEIIDNNLYEAYKNTLNSNYHESNDLLKKISNPDPVISHLSSQIHKINQYNLNNYSINKFDYHINTEEFRVKFINSLGKRLFKVLNHPCIEITINGKKCIALIDTGAEISIINNKFSKKLGLKKESINNQDHLKVALDYNPVKIDSILIGNQIIKNKIVYSTKNKIPRILYSLTKKVDIIIGWDIIRKMNLLLDYKNKEVIFNPKNVLTNYEMINYFPVAYPVLKINSNLSNPLIVLIDTGNNNTSGNSLMFDKIMVKKKFSNISKVRTIYGNKKYKTITEDIDLIINNRVYGRKNIEFQNLQTTFPIHDINLGSDFFSEYNLYINATEHMIGFLKSKQL